MSPAEFAALALRIDVTQVGAVERIKHGRTNASWLVTVGRERVVVRISNAEDASLQIDRLSEAVILRAIATIGIGAPVLLCDVSRRVLVTRYLGPTWTETDAHRLENIARLGEVLSLLHSVPPPIGVRSVRLLDVVDGFAMTLSLTTAGRNAAAHIEARKIAKLLDSSSRQRLCHNDIHAANIVDDGRIRLLDWEYAGINSPLFDLASVCVSHRYDVTQRQALLSAYAKTGEVSEELLGQACGLFSYVESQWIQVRGPADAAS